MEARSLNDEVIVRYLLGDLPEEEQARVEDRAFSDRQYLEEILSAEDDLIDQYVRGGFSDLVSRQFECRFLSSAGRQQKVEFARALARVTSEAAATEEVIRPVIAAAPNSCFDTLASFLRAPHPLVRFSFAAAALIIAIGGSWLIGERMRLRAEVARLQVERGRQEASQQRVADERARSEDLAAQLRREGEQRERSDHLVRQLQRGQLQRESASPSQSTIISLTLFPGISRAGADRPQLVIPRAVPLAQLQIGIARGDEYTRFRAELRTRGGQEVLSQNSLRAHTARAVILDLPASALDTGEYELA